MPAKVYPVEETARGLKEGGESILEEEEHGKRQEEGRAHRHITRRRKQARNRTEIQRARRIERSVKRKSRNRKSREKLSGLASPQRMVIKKR